MRKIKKTRIMKKINTYFKQFNILKTYLILLKIL